MLDIVIAAMKEVFAEVSWGVEHTLKVLDNAEQIMQGENISGAEKELTVLAAILHDIGAAEAQRKHGSMEAQYQEQEGPGIARAILGKAGYDHAVIQRVCYIVGNHHTQAKIDGRDFQILWEADLLENLAHREIRSNIAELEKCIADNFRTAAGRQIAWQRFLL